MDRLRHGYTNGTFVGEGGTVTKTYVGVNSTRRLEIERRCLEELQGVLPLPRFVGTEGSRLRMSLLGGTHGKDLLALGKGRNVLAAAGRCLRIIHRVDIECIDLPGEGCVLVHGDFGPQNLLFTGDGRDVVGVLDWEWAHFGEPVEDLAWTEWVVRKHHAVDASTLPSFFLAYGERPPWQERQAAMVGRCAELARSDPVTRGSIEPVGHWGRAIDEIRSWEPLPDDK